MQLPNGREWFLDFTNSGFLQENLSESSKTPFIVFEDENKNGLDEQIIVYILKQFQKEIYYIKSPIEFEVTHEIDIEDTVSVSIESIEQKENIYTIYPASLVCEKKPLGDNREYILTYLLQNNIKNRFAVVFATGIIIDNLCCQLVLKKHLERLYNMTSPLLESQMVFGCAGCFWAR